MVPMSTASAVLRRPCIHMGNFPILVPMSTASAVLRHSYRISNLCYYGGTYVYCFGGIETIPGFIYIDV